MKLGTRIELPDGRIGTICWHHLDGYGGVFGEHDFGGIELEGGFSDDLPAPEFMLREKSVEALLRKGPHSPLVECVGEEYVRLDGANDVCTQAT
jgi:hypothetical protein